MPDQVAAQERIHDSGTEDGSTSVATNRGLPSVMVPVFVQAIARNLRPLRGERRPDQDAAVAVASPLTTVTGVEITSAQGLAMTNTRCLIDRLHPTQSNSQGPKRATASAMTKTAGV